MQGSLARPGGTATRSGAAHAAPIQFTLTVGLKPAPALNRRDAGALQRRVVGLAGADADHALDVGDEDLAVADLAGLG